MQIAVNHERTVLATATPYTVKLWRYMSAEMLLCFDVLMSAASDALIFSRRYLLVAEIRALSVFSLETGVKLSSLQTDADVVAAALENEREIVFQLSPLKLFRASVSESGQLGPAEPIEINNSLSLRNAFFQTHPEWHETVRIVTGRQLYRSRDCLSDSFRLADNSGFVIARRCSGMVTALQLATDGQAPPRAVPLLETLARTMCSRSSAIGDT